MATTSGTKRKALDSDEEENFAKRSKVDTNSPLQNTEAPIQQAHEDETANESGQVAEGNSSKRKGKQRATQQDNAEAVPAQQVKYRKLAPPRPFPTVPTSVSATGPRSAHVEGKNYICITRRTPLGAYLRRCKDVVLKDGHKTLHLSAMGAAIPHLMQLAVSLPDILPYARDEIHTEVLTGTVEVQDEVIPDDEDEDISYRTRGKSTASVVIKVGDGVDEGSRSGKGRKNANKGTSRAARGNFATRGGKKQQNTRKQGGGQGGEKSHGLDDRDVEPVVVRLEDMEE